MEAQRVIAATDWTILLSFLMLLTFVVLSEESALFEILSGLSGIIFALVLDTYVLSTVAGISDLVRYGIFLIVIVMSVLFMVHGALNLPKEVRG